MRGWVSTPLLLSSRNLARVLEFPWQQPRTKRQRRDSTSEALRFLFSPRIESISLIWLCAYLHLSWLIPQPIPLNLSRPSLEALNVRLGPRTAEAMAALRASSLTIYKFDLMYKSGASANFVVGNKRAQVCGVISQRTRLSLSCQTVATEWIPLSSIDVCSCKACCPLLFVGELSGTDI